MKRFWIWLVKLGGWKFEIPDLKERPELRHCVVAVAPHTSIADFFVGAAVLFAAGVKPRIFIKKEFFNFVTNPILKGMGAVQSRAQGICSLYLLTNTEDDSSLDHCLRTNKEEEKGSLGEKCCNAEERPTAGNFGKRRVLET